MAFRIPTFDTKKILIVGDVMLDRYWSGHAARISPEAPVPVVNICQQTERPGGAGNVALNISALGAQCHLFALSGDDEAADSIENYLQQSHVSPSLTRNTAYQTPIKLRILAQHQQLIRLDFEKPTGEYDKSSLIESVKAHIAKADAVILSDYNKGSLQGISSTLIKMANEHNVPVLVDPKQLDYKHYHGATLITPNMKEFEATVGPCHTDHEIIEKGRALMAKHAIRSLLITRGGQGMMLLQEGVDEAYFPARGREVFDVTGAGDTVIATLAAAIAGELPLIHAVELASTAAGIVISKLGAATVTRDELEEALAGKSSQGASIVTQSKLQQEVETARARGEKIIFTNGCFDILHAMHVDYLKLAKALGGKLIVAVNVDESIRKSKGPGRPVNTLEHRMSVLAGLESVDWVVPFSEDTPIPLLKKIKPDILVKGGDYTPNEVVGHDIVKAYGGEVKILGGVIEGVKTTAIIKRSQKAYVEED